MDEHRLMKFVTSQVKRLMEELKQLALSNFEEHGAMKEKHAKELANTIAEIEKVDKAFYECAKAIDTRLAELETKAGIPVVSLFKEKVQKKETEPHEAHAVSETVEKPIVRDITDEGKAKKSKAPSGALKTLSNASSEEKPVLEVKQVGDVKDAKKKPKKAEG